MKKAKLLKSSIKTLKKVRLELQDNVENSVLKMLDKAISDLEAIQQTPEKFSAKELLNVLGKIMEKLPSIIELIHILTNMNK